LKAFMPHGELPHLETFCKAAELENFTAAAEALQLTQAAISQRIKAPEVDVGQPLFERTAGRVFLTESGRRLYDYARRILSLHDEARASLGQPVADVAGELHLAASTVPAEHLLPGILQAFHKKHPHVHVVAQVADSAGVLDALEQGKVSLALVGQAGPASWTESRPFAKDRLVLIVPAKHAWAKRSHVSMDEVHTQPLIVREPGSATRATLEEGLSQRRQRLSDFQVTLELGSNEAIKEAVLRGAGISFLSGFAVKEEVAARRLAALEVDKLDISRQLYLVTDRRRILPPPARAFLEVLESLPFTQAATI
jgi:DNA-binding transcriptional LysR family regulator